MEKVLFIIPPYTSFESFVKPGFNERMVVKKSGNYGSVLTDMPIGIISMSAYLKKYSDAAVKLLDFNIILNKLDNFKYDSFSGLFRDILSSSEWKGYAPDITGISTLFATSYYNMLELADVVREIFPDTLIVAGGGVPTNMYSEIFKTNKSFDALCFGEGEKPLLGLVKAENKKELLNSHPAWITKKKIQNKAIFRFDFIEDLDEIPFYDFDLLDIKQYTLNPTVAVFASYKGKNRIFHTAVSRGCTLHCVFCASHSVHGRKMRYHSLHRVKEDLLLLKEKYGAEIIGFQDDHFLADTDRAKEILKITKELGLGIFFQSGLALYSLSRKMLEAIKDAGLKQITIAVESGSNRVLKDIMHKPINLDMAKRVVKGCRELGIETDANILIGLPGETKKDLEDSRMFLRTLDVNWFRIYIATPLIGSEMLQICIEKKYLKGDYSGRDFKKAGIETEEFTAEYIQEQAYLLNLEINFVYNSDIRLKNYQGAIKSFENVLKVKSDHAFAFYYLAKCHKVLNAYDKYLDYKNKYSEQLVKSGSWKKYAEYFNLENL